MFNGHDAVFKLRCSAGVQVKAYLPKTKVQGEINDSGISDSPELVMSCVMPDTCIAIELNHRIGGIPGALDQNGRRVDNIDPTVYFQTALLYTNAFGRRRVRVTTLALRATTSVPEVFKAANFDALAVFMTRQAISDLSARGEEGSLHNARQAIADRCVNILVSYRRNTDVSTQPMGQLILPEALQLLPLFCLSLRKNRMFRSSVAQNSGSTCKPSPSADERAYHLFYGSNVSLAMAMLCVHPSLYRLTDMPADAGELVSLEPAVLGQPDRHAALNNHFEADELVKASCQPYIQLPPSTKPSVACLDDDSIYLLDDGFRFFVFIGRDVSMDARTEVVSFDDLDAGPNSVAGKRSVTVSTSSDFGARLWRIMAQLRKAYMSSAVEKCNRPVYPPVVVVIGRGGYGFRSTIDDSLLEDEMIESLVEDTSSDEKSYVDFLIDLHRRIKNATM